VLALELLDEEVDKTVIEIFPAEANVISSSFDLENTLFDGQNIKIENQHVPFANDFLKTVGDGSGSRFINDLGKVETGDGSSVACCESLE